MVLALIVSFEKKPSVAVSTEDSHSSELGSIPSGSNKEKEGRGNRREPAQSFAREEEKEERKGRKRGRRKTKEKDEGEREGKERERERRRNETRIHRETS